MIRSITMGVAAIAASLLVVACGGGSSDSGNDSGNDGGVTPPPGPTTAERTAAASATAQSDSNLCAPIRPFYWEIGDQTAAMASGSVNSSSDPTVYIATTPMSIASASKWLYSSYVVQKQNGVLSDADVKFLNFTSGYTNFTSCQPGQTVQQCVDSGSNGVYSSAADGRFDYGGGHMEKHASLIGLGPLDEAGLATEIRSQLGSRVSALCPGPIRTTPPWAWRSRPTRRRMKARMMISPISGSLVTRRRKSARRTRTTRLAGPVRALTRICRSLNWSSSPLNWRSPSERSTCGVPSSAMSMISMPPSTTRKKSTARSPREKRGVCGASVSSLP